jgi:hypothetical protein
MVPRLEALGFRSVGHFLIDRSVPNARAYVSLFENPRAGRTAQYFTVFGIRQVTTTLAFRTEFADGTALVTGNTRIATVLPPRLFREGSMSFPWVDDPEFLYEIHAASVVHYASDAIPIPTAIEDPIEFLNASHRRELARFVEAGYYRLDEASRRYRLTWKGAFVMSWKLLWPIKSIRLMLRRRKAARLLRELGLDEPGWDERPVDRAPVER